MPRATWTAGTPTVTKDAAGTITASVPLKDAGVLAFTLTLAMTVDRALRIDVTSVPGPNGLTDFQAWSNT